MDGSRKRKAANTTPSTGDSSASKKLRLLNSNPTPAAQNNVREIGEKLLEGIKRATDKHGRPIATQFLTLPDPDELPDYYEVTLMPLALDTIAAKLKRDEYPTITSVESDVRRMVINAKEYNDPKSEIHQDAERVRKNAFNFMKIHNPAYKDPNYAAFPTPIPEELLNRPPKQSRQATGGSGSGQQALRQTSEKPKQAIPVKEPEQSDRKSSIAPSATTANDDDQEGTDAALDFTGKSFQEAQQAIISYLLGYTDEEGLEIYFPFRNLPSRKLEDYYKVIKHCVCLKGMAKRARGEHGRAAPTNVTDFKTWDAFANEMSFIWRNARDYNEDGSDMYELANEFEKHFKSLLAEAKEKVDEPSGPKLKIGGPKPKVTLNLSHRQSPTPGVTVDDEALARQRQLVQAGVNGQSTVPIRPPAASLPNGVAHLPNGQPPSSAQSGSPPDTTIKYEKGATQSPALKNSALAPTQSLTNGTMPPPLTRPSSGSPFPTQLGYNNYSHTYTAPTFLPPTQIRPYPAEASLLPSVTINTHPQLKIPQPYYLSIAPHPTLSHQSTTTTLPSTHYFLQISATLSKQLSMGRPYKIFVSVNGTRLTQRDTQYRAETGRRTHVYEGSLAQGVNRIEVETAAARVDGQEGLDVERVTVFANLMR